MSRSEVFRGGLFGSFWPLKKNKKINYYLDSRLRGNDILDQATKKGAGNNPRPWKAKFTYPVFEDSDDLNLNSPV